MCDPVTIIAFAVGGALVGGGGAALGGGSASDIIKGAIFGAVIGAVSGGAAAWAGGATAGAVTSGAMKEATRVAIMAGVRAAAVSTTLATGGITMSKTATKQQQKQMNAMRRLQEEQLGQINNGKPEVSRVASGLSDNPRMNRALSSLRIGLLPQRQSKEQLTQNVYGVDTNQLTTSSQNMLGLNIAVA